MVPGIDGSGDSLEVVSLIYELMTFDQSGRPDTAAALCRELHCKTQRRSQRGTVLPDDHPLTIGGITMRGYGNTFIWCAIVAEGGAHEVSA